MVHFMIAFKDLMHLSGLCLRILINNASCLSSHVFTPLKLLYKRESLLSFLCIDRVFRPTFVR